MLRAAIIIGSGSASFEMLRYLTERLPVMVTPKWVHNRIQPIAIRDVLHYLTRAATLPDEVNRGFDIGGPDVLTYLDMMRRYAVVAGLPRRLVVPVPVLTPWLSAQWVNLVTPVPRSIAVPLIESLVHEVVCHDRDIARLIPDPDGGLTHYERAIELALARVRNADVPTRWSDATPPNTPSDPLPTDPDWSGGTVYEDVRERHTDADQHTLWQVIESIGGEHGWYSFPLAWSARGWIDRIVGGVGLRRGRRDPRRLHTGEALDWWRVERLDRPHLLRLRAEMLLPGRHGWNCRRLHSQAAARCSGSGRSSNPTDSPATCTGSPSRPSTASSSAAWRATSPAPPKKGSPARSARHKSLLDILRVLLRGVFDSGPADRSDFREHRGPCRSGPIPR